MQIVVKVQNKQKGVEPHRYTLFCSPSSLPPSLLSPLPPFVSLVSSLPPLSVGPDPSYISTVNDMESHVTIFCLHIIFVFCNTTSSHTVLAEYNAVNLIQLSSALLLLCTTQYYKCMCSNVTVRYLSLTMDNSYYIYNHFNHYFSLFTTLTQCNTNYSLD